MITIEQYTKAVAVTPSDTVDFVAGGRGSSQLLADGIYVGGAGVVAIVFQDGTVINFTCVAGQTLKVKCRRVNSTNTTATLMNALYAI